MTQPAQQTQAIERAAVTTLDDIARKAKAISTSDIIPQEYRGKVGNCLIAMEMAERMGCAPLQIMQSMHIIHGRPTFSAQWLIATVNASGRFSPLRWRWLEDGKGKRVGAVAYATDKATNELLEGPAVTLEMARAEGWSTKSGSKWQTMPEVMMMYRSAAFWARLYCPEVAMGLHTSDEAEDIARCEQPVPVRSFGDALAALPEAPAAPMPETSGPAPIVDDETGEVLS